jgi:hypothetical protein
MRVEDDWGWGCCYKANIVPWLVWEAMTVGKIRSQDNEGSKNVGFVKVEFKRI